MPITEKEYFVFERETYPVVTIYDEEDAEEAVRVLQETEKMAISLESLSLLSEFPHLKRLVLLPGMTTERGLQTLYTLRGLELLDTDYVETEKGATDRIDVSRFPVLQALSARSSWNYCGISGCNSLRTLKVREWHEKDLLELRTLQKLDCVSISLGSLRSLTGLEGTRIRCLELSYLRSLHDISALSDCKCLQALRIEHCPKIVGLADILRQLDGLTMLAVTGSRGIFENLDFIDGMKDLRFFVTDFNILDGKVERLKQLPYASVLQDRRHYDVKDKDLSRGCNVLRGIEDIPKWRRIM